MAFEKREKINRVGDGMSNIRSTPEGKDKNKQTSEDIRNDKITRMQEIHNNSTFPPTFDDS